MNTDNTIIIDAKGLQCPMPALKLAQGLLKVKPGETVRLISTDVGSTHDVPAFCQQYGHKLVSTYTNDEHAHIFEVSKSQAQ